MTLLGVFSQKLSGKQPKNKVVAYLASHNAKGSSGNTVENVEDEDSEFCFYVPVERRSNNNNFILLKYRTTNKEF